MGWRDIAGIAAGFGTSLIPGVGPWLAPMVGGAVAGGGGPSGGDVSNAAMGGVMRGNLNRGMGDAFGFTGSATPGGATSRTGAMVGGDRDFGADIQQALQATPTVTSGGGGAPSAGDVPQGGGGWTTADKVGLGLAGAGMGFDIYNQWKQGRKHDKWLEGSKDFRSALIGGMR